MKQKTTALLFAAAALVAAVALAAGLPLIVARMDKTGADPRRIVTEHTTPAGGTFWQISAGPANAWLLPADDGYLLIDTGYPADYDRFFAGLKAADIDASRIRYLFITHAHDEHAGFAARLKKETGCILILPRKSLEGLASGRFDWKGKTVNPVIHGLGKLYNLIKKRDFRFEPVLPSENDMILDGTESSLMRQWGIPGTLMATPGHTADSWSLVMDDGRAFTGDAAMNMLVPFGAGYRPIFMEDRREVYSSFDKIREAGATEILSGHGSPFPVDKLPVYREKTAAGPGMSSLPGYVIRLLPGFILLFLLLWLGRKADAGFRIGLYILGFILMRDLMTPMGYWTFGSDPVFWIRFAADGKLLSVLAAGSLVLSLLIILRERKGGITLNWFRGFPLVSVLAGVAGALVIALPLVVMYLGILPGERGGFFPRTLLPAVLAIALAGNLLEEILFRGYLQDWFSRQGMRPPVAALSSGLAFGLCHAFLAFTVTDVGLPLLLFAVWEGTFCGFLKNRFGLTAPVLTHGLAIAILSLV
jgi:glyoxylase-like metal-dependent hydrolase (beta-lactamase superfamily II)/membrane protease YdiL (CAAX protease family)